jgi:hypothetical protein
LGEGSIEVKNKINIDLSKKSDGVIVAIVSLAIMLLVAWNLAISWVMLSFIVAVGVGSFDVTWRLVWLGAILLFCMKVIINGFKQD